MRLKFISFFIIIILLVFILSGCISDDKNSKKEIRQLKKELSQKDRRIEELEVKLKLRLKSTKKKKDIMEGLI